MYKLNQNSITRLSDSALIPFAEGNTDYHQYLAWIAEGNTPEPADIPDPQLQINADARAYLDSTGWVVEKMSEYSLLGIDTAPYLLQYADILTKRQEARDAIV